ncbi:Carboxylic ester hydrolase [Mycena indigotica]|uniref:Carboxylic ester hydrolase n=1 Tax=Mycena indigotica TaxID=2126181 RepID=A0A8H6WAU8_9AGAR|nr:Carboxylic ester hydrolase [Mycena indigotica]KAF7311954.1 Carboxylic ester hydrolase [Mycena indigotica]
MGSTTALIYRRHSLPKWGLRLMHLWRFFAVVVTTVLSASAQNPIVDLGYAQYQGAVSSANYAHFFGIRYAAAPLGDLRFRAPQPPPTLSGVQDATNQPDQCFQSSNGGASTNPLRDNGVSPVNPPIPITSRTPSSEDCLFLNVYYPSDAAGTPPQGLPVLVWIHGGGYLGGQANPWNGEDILNQSNRKVVVVIIQYRLGVFGFLPGEKVKQNGALNAGLRMRTLPFAYSIGNVVNTVDQDAALRWVNQHIAKFGGDPSKVTIWGESAGAGSVLQQIIANDGQTEPQLFHAAIVSSTFLPSQYQYNDRIPELLFSKVATQVNCDNATDTMACLRAVDANSLETANSNINVAGFFGTFTLVPVIDGVFIRQRPTLALAQGKVNGQKLLAVLNTFEGDIFVDGSTVSTANATQYAYNLFPTLSLAQASQVGQLYSGLGSQFFQANAIQSEAIFVCATYYLLRAFSGRAYKAELAVPPGTHGSDIGYYFPSFWAPVFPDRDFINAFAQMFTSFIISQDPNIDVDPLNPTITPDWGLWSESPSQTEMLFNRTESNEPFVQASETSQVLLDRCAFWEGIGATTGQ